MAARKQARVRPVDAALLRLLTLIGRGAAPARMAREVELIAAAWSAAPEADASETRERLAELHEQVAAGVIHAEEQASDGDAGDAAASRQRHQALAALIATREAAGEAIRRSATA